MKNTYIVILTTLSVVLFWIGGASVYAQDGEKTRNPLETTVTEQGDTVRVQRNPETGTAHRVYGMSKNVRQYNIAQEGLRRNSIPEFSQALFEDYANVLNIDPTTLTRERAQTDGDLWFVSYTQTVGGVPVYGTEIGYTIGKRGNVIALGADAYPSATPGAVPTEATVSKKRALEIARETFSVDSAQVKEDGTLVILPEDGTEPTFRLTWKIRLFALDPPKDLTYFVDARNGRVVQKRSNLKEVRRSLNDDPPARPSSISRPVKMHSTSRFEISSRSGTISGQITGDVYPEYPGDTPQSEGLHSKEIEVYNSYGQRVATVSAGDNGNWSTGWLSSGTYEVVIPLQNDWVLPQRGDGVAGPDDPDGNTFQHSTYVSTVGGDVQYDHSWTAGNATGDETNVLHHATVVHDFFKGAPFNYSGMDYQMTAYTNQGSTIGAAANGDDVIFGSRNGYQYARSSDAIYHEYTHNTIHQIYGGWINNLGDGSNDAIEAAAMDEGLSDYFAGTLNKGALIAENVGVSRDLDNDTYVFDPDCSNYSDCDDPAHWNGQVIGGAAWDMRQAVGATTADRLVFKAMQITPQPRQFSDFADNVIIADEQLYGGTHTNQIQQAFNNHGISASIPPLDVTLSGPTWRDNGEQGTWTASVSGGSGSTSYDWEYQSVPSSTGWYSTYCSGASCSHTFYNYSSSQVEQGKIRVTVTKGSEQDQASRTVNVNPAGGYYSSVAKRRTGAFQALDASADGGGAAEVRWSTRGPLPAAEFVVEHRRDSTAAWTEVGRVAAADSVGAADRRRGASYRYRADGLSVGTHQFRLQLQRKGAKKAFRSRPVSAEIRLKEAYEVTTYPNPVRTQTTVEVAVKERQPVSVSVYDVLGRKVTTLHDGPLPAQNARQLTLDASEAGLSSGTYFVRVRGKAFADTHRLTVVR